MNYAMIQDGVVCNVAVWDGVSPWHPDFDVVQIPEDVPVSIGWGYDPALNKFLPLTDLDD
jgi:hypothetical protein